MKEVKRRRKRKSKSERNLKWIGRGGLRSPLKKFDYSLKSFKIKYVIDY